MHPCPHAIAPLFTHLKIQSWVYSFISAKTYMWSSILYEFWHEAAGASVLTNWCLHRCTSLREIQCCVLLHASFIGKWLNNSTFMFWVCYLAYCCYIELLVQVHLPHLQVLQRHWYIGGSWEAVQGTVVVFPLYLVPSKTVDMRLKPIFMKRDVAFLVFHSCYYCCNVVICFLYLSPSCGFCRFGK